MIFSSDQVVFSKLRGDLNSIKIRCDQISEALGVKSLYDSEIDDRKVKIIVYVKFLPNEEILIKRQQKGIVQIYDIIDNFEFKKFANLMKYIKVIIANSVSHKIFLEQNFGNRIEILPHHHCNFKNERITIKNNQNLIIGYIGDKTHYKKIKFLHRNFKNFQAFINFDNLSEKYKSIDIGVGYRTDEKKIRFNSNLKLLNYMSFGIPSVINYEHGFSEIGNHGVNCLFAINKKELIQNIEYLINNIDLRIKLSRNAFESAKKYHITEVSKLYINFFKSL